MQYEAVVQIECLFLQLPVASIKKLKKKSVLNQMSEKVFFLTYQMHVACNLPFQTENIRCFFGKANLFSKFT